MKRKILRILLFSSIILVLGAICVGLFMWNFTQKSEKLSGTREKIPQKTSQLSTLLTGNSDWISWQGKSFDRKSNFKGIKKDWLTGLVKKWEVSFLCQDDQTATWSAAVIQGNVLVVPGRDEKNGLVFCLNSETGGLIWKGSYEVKTNTNHGPGARATPFIDNDRVYTYGRSGDLVCWNLEDGKILWHKKAAGTGGVEPDWGYSSSPLVCGNKVIIQTGGRSMAVAYDKLTGDVLWTSEKGPGGYAPLNVLNADSSLLLFSGEALSGINRETGAIIWTLSWIVDYKVNASMPVSEGNIVFVTSGYGKGCMAARIENGKASVLWQSKDITGQQSDPVIIDGFVYGYSGSTSVNKGNLVCLRLSDGKLMWKSTEAGSGTFAVADGYLVCLDLKGNLYLVKADPDKFVKSAEMKNAITGVKHPAWTAPVIANGKLYLRYLQNLICYDISE